MDLDNSLAFFINQGPVFWAAAASVGAGGALLITALFVYFRRFLCNRRSCKQLGAAEPSGNPAKSFKPEIQVTGTGYSLSTPGAQKRQEPLAYENALGALLVRLRVAGNHLEESYFQNQNKGPRYSPLKTSPDSVENEFRVGMG